MMIRFGFATLLICGLVTDASAFGRKGCGGGRQSHCGNTQAACHTQTIHQTQVCQARTTVGVCTSQAGQACPRQVAFTGHPVQNLGSHFVATTAAIQAALPSFPTCNKQGCNKPSAANSMNPIFFQNGTPYSR